MNTLGKNCYTKDGRIYLRGKNTHSSMSFDGTVVFEDDMSDIELPEGFSTLGRIEFNNCKIKKFPDNMSMLSLTVTGESPTVWPKGLQIETAVDISKSSFKTLPTGLKHYNHKVIFEDCDIEFLEDDLVIENRASFYRSRLKATPDNMFVRKSLD